MRRSSENNVPSSKRSKLAATLSPIVNNKPLNVFVFGSSSLCELGLGPRVVEVKRPRLNNLLGAKDVGIVKIAVGGAHCLALDHEGKVWSWGQNDSGVLGRPTKENPEEIDEENDLNAKESTPGLVVGIPANTHFVDICATDNLSAAITKEGRLWAWGTFVDDGQKAFNSTVHIQRTPTRDNVVRNAVSLAAGKNHILILTRAGQVYAWGTGECNQLGVKVNRNLRTRTFGPLKIPKVNNIKYISAGDYQSFAINTNNQVYAWGLNNFGQCGISDEVGPNALVEKPTHVAFWDGKAVEQIASGSHHTVWLDGNGDIWTVGETNFHQLGIPYENLPENTVREQSGSPSYVPAPTKLLVGVDQDVKVQLPKFKFVAAGTDHSLAISAEDGSPWTWGFGEVYQLGHGKPSGEDSPEDEPVPTRIRNTATLGVNMCFAGAGGQFSVLAAEAGADGEVLHHPVKDAVPIDK